MSSHVVASNCNPLSLNVTDDPTGVNASCIHVLICAIVKSNWGGLISIHQSYFAFNIVYANQSIWRIILCAPFPWNPVKFPKINWHSADFCEYCCHCFGRLLSCSWIISAGELTRATKQTLASPEVVLSPWRLHREFLQRRVFFATESQAVEIIGPGRGYRYSLASWREFCGLETRRCW